MLHDFLAKQGREHMQVLGRLVYIRKECVCFLCVYELGSLCYPGYQMGLSWLLIGVQ